MRRILSLLLISIAILFAVPAHSQALWSNTNTATLATSGSLSASMNVTQCSPNCVAFAWVSTVSTGGYPGIAITYGGDTMTSAGTPAQENISSTNYQLEWFYLINPPSGSNTIAITASGGGVTVSQTKTNLIAFTGVDQITPVRPGTYQTTSTTGTSISLTISSNVQDMSITATMSSGGLPQLSGFGTNQVGDGINNTNNPYAAAASDHAQTPAASVMHTWTYNMSTSPLMAGFSVQGASFTPVCIGGACIQHECTINFWASMNVNTCTLPSVTAGNKIICVCLVLTSVCPDFSVSDTFGTTYTTANTQCGSVFAGESALDFSLVYATLANSGSVTVTLLNPQFGFSAGTVAEVSGLGAFDTATGANGTTNTGTLSSGNLTTAHNGELMFGGAFSVGTQLTVGTGYTLQFFITGSQDTNPNSHYGNFFATEPGGVAGVHSATFSTVGTPVVWAIVAGAFDVTGSLRHKSVVY